MDLVTITPASDDGLLVVSVIVDILDLFPPSSDPAVVLPEAIRVLEEAQRHHEAVCQRCGSIFTATNSARFCSGRCRVSAHRARHRAGSGGQVLSTWERSMASHSQPGRS